MNSFPVIFSFVVFTICHFTGSSFSQEISDQCLGCICEASTGCNLQQGCSEQGVCGPFLITYPFWADGGKFHLKGTDPSSPNAYAECVKEVYCASETVRGYMTKYAKDCNGDGKIDCEDFARLHKMGAYACESKDVVVTDFYKKFSTCKNQIRPA